MFAALLLALAAPPSIAWIDDDFEAARKRAVAEKKLVAVDVWATWCHTCLSMKRFVLTEPPVAKLADRHVWAMLDYDLPKNAGFFADYPITAFPTFLVIDPETGKVVARWLGSGTAEEMARFFAGAAKDASEPIAMAQRALAEARLGDAAQITEKALAAEKDPERRTQLLGMRLEVLWKLDPPGCARFGAERLGETTSSVPGLDFAATTLMCADELPAAEKTEVAKKVIARLLAAKQAGLAGLAVDDRSSAYDTLASAYDAAGEPTKADAIVKEQAALLEAAAKAAKTPAEAAVFDAHRLGAYLRLQRFADAEAMLTASEKSFPADYNPPARLALLYLKMGKTDAGLAAIDRALARGYGPRRVRLYTTKLDLLAQKKDVPAARRVIAEARADLQKLDPRLVRKSWIEQLDRREKALPPPPAGSPGPR